MKVLTDIDQTPEEIYSLIENVTIIKEPGDIVKHITETKLFQGFYLSKRLIITTLKNKEEILLGANSNFWFYVSISCGKTGKSILNIHMFPSLVHVFLLIMTVISLIVGSGAPLLVIPILLVVIVGNITSYVKTKKLLLSVLKRNI